MQEGHLVHSPEDSGTTNTLLAVSNLGVRVGDKTILEGLTFNVEKGTAVAIVGPNGSGKTTLFRALMNLVPYTGTIKWRNVVRIGYVPQSLITTDLPISVEEFLRFKCRTDFDACMNSVGLSKQVLKHGLGSLSGGELQRVLIAWAIADNPDILLFDEPTSALDIGAVEPVYDKVTLLKKKNSITVLLITHSPHVVMHYSDHVLALNKRLVFYGETTSLSHSRLLSLMHGNDPLSQEQKQLGEQGGSTT